ncbi:MAG: tyrosine-type recombinase/integrase [Pseudomonadota bacterium]|nr:tyrosine-type recombinase/integrase [Pseudomonadota bacterium]
MRKRDEKRHQLGRYWLYQRPDTGFWSICWLDTSAVGQPLADGRRGRAVTRRKATGVSGGSPESPPAAALDALAVHHQEHGRERKQDNDEALVEDLIADWLEQHVAELAAPDRYRYSAAHWVSFFQIEERAGRIRTGLTVSQVNPDIIKRFVDWRRSAGAGGHTISRDIAALRGALNYAWKTHRIPSAPYIADVKPEQKAAPRDRVLSFKEVAALMDACTTHPYREHVLRFMVIELGTAGRPQAVLELTDANVDIENNLIDPNSPGKTHARKRRAIVPIAKHVLPWVKGVSGKIIKLEMTTKEGSIVTRDTISIKTAWRDICHDAGVVRPKMQSREDPKTKKIVKVPVLDGDGNPVMEPDATPKTLRHTMLTWLAKKGVPKEQRMMLAGHAPRDTTARNYEHLTPDYLVDAVTAIDAWFEELSKHTTAHLRSVSDPQPPRLKVVNGGRV